RTTSPRGEPTLSVSALLSMPGDVFVLFTRPPSPDLARRAVQALGDDAGLLVSRSYGPGEAAAIDAARALSEATGLGLVASGAARYHCRSRKPLMDTLTAIRLGVPVDKAGYALEAHAERSLMSPRELAHRFHTVGLGAAVDRGLSIAEQCTLNLDELRFVYPEKHLPAGTTPIAHFVDVVLAGARARYGDPLPPGAERQLRHELGVVERMRVEGFFLTMHDIVSFARQQGILCQGRGSAANSAICYALGITSVDPVSAGLLFERFISEERGEPPDIDVDFEHERREEVIQFVYDFYGRDHTALVCENICYRMRSAVRDVGKAVGLSLDQVDRLAKAMSFWTPERGDDIDLTAVHGADDGPDDPLQLDATRLRDAGIDPASRVAGLLRALVPQLLGFPRHRGTHVGGMVVTHEPLIDTAPLEPAAMPNRAILPWDKDDCDILGMCKFDLLALGMLSALRKAFALVEQHHGVTHALNTIPQGDSLTYERIRAADTLGTFQIESRAQMATLPRLRPERFYDIVVAISIIRPGPIQGGMVHPYLRRRNGEEPITFPHPSLVPILARTLGVPLFQEQVMRIAVDAAGFTPGESDELRRKMGAWRKRGTMGDVRDRLIRGMAERGIGEAYAEQIFSQIKGFGEYGFPESHAISFALLAYASAFLKTHFPAAFACALLNSQPMGFYSPHTIVEDARRHGVIVLPIDVEHSDWDCTLEQGALRVGVRYVAGLGSAAEARFARAVARRPFRSIDTFAAASGFDAGALGRLAHAGAFRSLERIDWHETSAPDGASPRPGWGLAAGEVPGDDRACRRAAYWQVLRLHEPGTLPLGDDPIASFPRMSPAEEVRADYETA
ncbi:MAG: error-prone DNA polymerase, partial [Myxococcales bacterium]|nr:error-prone DNA polymerase [Myxococcales bacterium]